MGKFSALKNIAPAAALFSIFNFQFSICEAQAPKGGKAISDELIGIFFEDISYAADGGLNADLVQNGGFEYCPSDRDGWGPGTSWKFIRPGHSAGYIEPRMDNTIHPNNTTYMRIHAERTKHFDDFDGWSGVGIQNEGYNGMNIKAGAKYDLAVFLRVPSTLNPQPSTLNPQPLKVRFVLVKTTKNKEKVKDHEITKTKEEILAEDTITINGNGWNKYTSVLTASEDCKDASLKILLLDNGAVDIDVISLVPQDTYHGHGLRKDLAETLEALHPKFMRFPGGCVVHGGGDGFWDTYRWKTTVGPKETRKAIKNTWGYGQSMELGYYEYFQLCEDMNMQPVPILPCGVSCQGVNGGWSMKGQAQEVWPMDDMDVWVQDALDLIEWANGDVNTKWGAVRAAAGHPKPFNLKYLGVGNEERISPEFCERFKYMYKKIMEKHPEIIIIGTAGPGSHPGNSDYDNAWKLAEEIGMPIIDEHYYEPRNFFLTKRQYDKYPRTSLREPQDKLSSAQVRKTKVYLGEYSVQEKKHGNQWGDALAEALYLMNVEKNGDVVSMTSYAPLFAYKKNTNWNPDLIYFDNEKPFLTCSYYVQQMFGQSSGNYYYGDCVKFANGDDENKNLKIGQSVILNTKTRQVFVKVANYTDDSKKVNVNLSRFHVKGQATVTVLKGNLDDENNYEKHPVSPVTTTTKAKSKMTLDVEPHSLVMYSYKY